jgi:uncharacterized protein YxeA
MKKLLLGLTTLLALTTITLYAACTADVDMGSNKIINLSAGTTDGDAVNYEQTLKRYEANAINVDGNMTMDRQIKFVKVGNICTVEGQYHWDNQTNEGVDAFQAPNGFLPSGLGHFPTGIVLCTDGNTSRLFMQGNGIVDSYNHEVGSNHCVINMVYACK